MTRFGKAFVTLIIGLLAAVSAFAFGAPKVAHASISCPLVSHTTRSFYYDNKDGGAISLYYYYSSLYQCVDVQLVVSVPSSGPSMVAPVDGMVEVFVCASPGNPMFVAGSAFKNASTPRWEFSLALPSAYTNFSFGNNFMVRQYGWKGLGTYSTSFYGPGGHLYSTDNGNLPAESLPSGFTC